MSRKYKNRTLPRGILVDRELVYIRVFERGKTKPFLKSFGNVNDKGVLDTAIAELHRIREQIRLGKFKQEDKTSRIRFLDAAEMFLIKKPVWRGNFKGLLEFFNNYWLDEITYLKVADYRPWRSQQTKRVHGEDKPIEQSSINRELTGLSSMISKLKLWVELGEIRPIDLPPHNPVKLVRKLKGGWYDERLSRRKRVLSPTELPKFIELSPVRLQRIIIGALNTALRKKDLLALKKDNTTLAAEQLEGLQSKVGSMYIVPNNNNLKWLFDTTNESVFDDTNFRKEFDATRLKLIEELRKDGIECEWFQFKDLRRTALRKVWDETKDLLLCRDLAGHKDAKTTQLYLGLTDFDVKKAGEVLQRHFSFDVIDPDKAVGQ